MTTLKKSLSLPALCWDARYRDTLAIALLWTLAVIGALSRPLMPIDETRYVSVAWEMWHAHSWVLPLMNGEPYSDKPPLLFWLIQAGWGVFGVNAWWPKLIAPLAALVAMQHLYRIARRLGYAGSRARVAPMVLMAMLMWNLYSGALMFDILLTACLLGAISPLVSGALTRRRALQCGVWLGLALLAKGPAVFVTFGPILLGLRWWRTEPLGAGGRRRLLLAYPAERRRLGAARRRRGADLAAGRAAGPGGGDPVDHLRPADPARQPARRPGAGPRPLGRATPRRCHTAGRRGQRPGDPLMGAAHRLPAFETPGSACRTTAQVEVEQHILAQAEVAAGRTQRPVQRLERGQHQRCPAGADDRRRHHPMQAIEPAGLEEARDGQTPALDQNAPAATLGQQRQRGRLHTDAAPRPRLSPTLRLVGHIDHVRLATGVEMRQGHDRIRLAFKVLRRNSQHS